MENMHTHARFKGLIPYISLEQFFFTVTFRGKSHFGIQDLSGILTMQWISLVGE